MEEMLAAVTAEIRKKAAGWQQQESLWSVLSGFFHAIDWREPWIVGILASHVALLALALLTRKREGAQLTLFATLMAIVFSGEQLNALGRRHWTKFATQPYFDEAGAFFSAVVSGPLMLILFVLLINYLWSCFNLMVVAKRKELRYKAKQRRAQEASTGGNGSAEAVGTGGTAAEGKKAK